MKIEMAERIKEGYLWQKWMGDYFSLHGYDVDCPDLTIEEFHRDPYDLIVSGMVVEIKTKDKSIADFDRYPTIFLDSVYAYSHKEKTNPPDFYVVLFKRSGKMIWTSGDSENWTKCTVWNSLTESEGVYWQCPKVNFRSMESLLDILRNPRPVP
jgi:hypothetical protein